MNEYSDSLAQKQQRQAFDGDCDACMALIDMVKPHARAKLKDSAIIPAYHEDVWQDIVYTLAQMIASGNIVERWSAYAHGIVTRVFIAACRSHTARERREARYMERINERYRDAYPAVHECVGMLEPVPQDLIRRMYFRAVRQNMMEFAEEHCMNYYRVRMLHFRTLDALRGMLVDMGITHA
jgi:DNA-directed RNA polymerase specialized sigma24 family protein